MKKYKVEGGFKLNGRIKVFGAKNAINKQLVASLLTDELCVFHNVPQIQEVESVLGMLSELGAKYEWNENTISIQTKSVITSSISAKYSGVNRIPILLLSALIHRCKDASVPFVGGCNIGARPIDFHIEGLRKMGAAIVEEDNQIKASCKKLEGCYIQLPFPSIGATENLLLAGCLAEGTTVISNAALEPEILDTIMVLQKMGAMIYIDADRKIIIEGVDKLRGVEHSVIPDRMEVAALVAASLATNGKIKILDAKQQDIITLLNTVRKMGGDFEVDNEGISFFRKGENLIATHIETDVHPSFMTDWQQPFVVALTQAEGASVVHETIYENRFGFTKTLNELGANITLSNKCLGNKPCRFVNKNYLHSAVIIGPTPLKAKNIEIPDLRAGFAYLIASLVAEGVSIVSGIYHIERGHPFIVERLKEIGAKIEYTE